MMKTRILLAAVATIVVGHAAQAPPNANIGLGVHPFDPLRAPGTRLEGIRKILCFTCNLFVTELHDAHGVGRLTVIRQDVFADQRSPLPMTRRTAKRFLLGCLARVICMLRRPRIRSPDCGCLQPMSALPRKADMSF